MNPYPIDTYEREILTTPNGSDKILLHSCCAPCSAEIMLALVHSKIDVTLFFYNPNIHPKEEYEIRKNENKRFADKIGMKFIDVDYDKDEWFKRVKGFEHEPERGKRCTLCFDFRFERTALYAYENNFNLISSTLSISRWKNFDQINESGERVVKKYNGMIFWTFNWRKKGGSMRMHEISKNEKFYKQEYCGCVYSLRDMNLRRKRLNRPVIERGTQFYTN